MILVAKFTKDNKCFFEFHTHGFFVKDIQRNQILQIEPGKNRLYGC